MIGKKELIYYFKELGIQPGMVIEVHGSLQNTLVTGNAQTIIDALLDVIGYEGTILLPLHCTSNTEPSTWTKPIIQPSIVPTIRKRLPAYSNKNSDTYENGILSENLRRRDNVIFSSHPNKGYIAIGKYAKQLCQNHSNNFAFSIDSPSNKLLELKGYILLLDSTYKNISSLNLSQYYYDTHPIIINCAMVNDQGHKTFNKYLDIQHNNTIYDIIGSILENQGQVNKITINKSSIKLIPFDKILNTTIKYINNNSIINLYR